VIVEQRDYHVFTGKLAAEPDPRPDVVLTD
jgi:hypothetical protein